MVKALASHQGSGFNSRRRRHLWVEFVVGSLPCSDRFFSGYSGFPLSLKTNTSKFQFDLDMQGHILTSSFKELLSVSELITIYN